MGKVIGRSILKGLKDTGRLAAAAALVALADPDAVTAAWAIAGPLAPVAVVAVNFAARVGLDALKHRDKVGE